MSEGDARAESYSGWGLWFGVLIAVCAILALAWRSWPEHRVGSYPPLRWQDIAPHAAESLRDWRWIVIHHSGAEVGDAQGIDRDHLNRPGWEGLGYHFVIGNGRPMQLGHIEWSFRWNLQRHGAHVGVGDYNQHSIGICLIGNFDQAPPDPIQYARAVDLAATLIRHIPGLSPEQIIGHGEAHGANTACPGSYLNMDDFRAAVARRLAE